jgi:hypothetical protein
MDLDLWALVLSVAGIAVPAFAFLWEFFFVGRKRLGYRVQLDTTARDEIGSEHAGVLAEMKPDAGSKLVHPSFVLAFSDGAKADLQPQLLPRPVAFMLFTLVVNKDAGVGDLTIDQVRRLYDGQIANWKDIGGKDIIRSHGNRPCDELQNPVLCRPA